LSIRRTTERTTKDDEGHVETPGSGNGVGG
jgi:hypothetical protein